MTRLLISKPALGLVAEVYDEAVAAGDWPTRAVAETFGLSRAVAAKRVMAARRAGLLPSTVKGRMSGSVPRHEHRCECGTRWPH